MEDSSLILSSGSTAVLCALLLQYLKNAAWVTIMGVEQAYQTMNRLVSIALAGAASIGIHFTFDSAAGQLVITGLTLSALLHGSWGWATQWALQHGIYKAMVVPVELAVKNGQLQRETLAKLQLAADRQLHITNRARKKTRDAQKKKAAR